MNRPALSALLGMTLVVAASCSGGSDTDPGGVGGASADPANGSLVVVESEEPAEIPEAPPSDAAGEEETDAVTADEQDRRYRTSGLTLDVAFNVAGSAAALPSDSADWFEVAEAAGVQIDFAEAQPLVGLDEAMQRLYRQVYGWSGPDQLTIDGGEASGSGVVIEIAEITPNVLPVNVDGELVVRPAFEFMTGDGLTYLVDAGADETVPSREPPDIGG